MDILVKLIVNHIVRAVKSVFFKAKMAIIDRKLKKSKKEAKNAKTKSDSMVDDFRSEYSNYLWKPRVRQSSDEMREDGGRSGSNNKTTRGSDSDSRR